METPTKTPATPRNMPGLDDLEHDLAEIWCEVLEREEVAYDVSFFDVGGQSMALVSVAALVQERLGHRVDMMTLLTHPTIESLATHLRGPR